MKENTNVRQVTLGDYKHIDSWYKKRNELRPISILLPNGGLDGFIVEKNKQPIAVIYLYLTNSKMGYMDFLMSDPDYKEQDRYELIMMLLKYCTHRAIKAGLQCVFVTTKIPALVKKGKELGFREDLICEEESRVIIYTYESKNKIFI